MTSFPDRWLTEVVQTYEYPTTGLHSFILILFEKYSNLLEKQFGKRFKDVRTTMESEFLLNHMGPIRS